MGETYKEFALDLAKKAGKVIKKNFGLSMKKSWKADHTPLTETDLKINQMVIEEVGKHFPAHSVLAEEGSHMKKESEYVWVCDPLDGTIPFSHGIPTCVFSLAFVKDGQSVLGVIYDPFLDRMVIAQTGQGAFLNGEKIHVSKKAELGNAAICSVAWKDSPYDLERVNAELVRRFVKTINVGSIAYTGMLVAVGEFAATIFPGTKPHDTAALKVIVEEAGGKVTDLFGREQRYDRDIRGHITSNGILHQQLAALVKKLMP